MYLICKFTKAKENNFNSRYVLCERMESNLELMHENLLLLRRNLEI